MTVLDTTSSEGPPPRRNRLTRLMGKDAYERGFAHGVKLRVKYTRELIAAFLRANKIKDDYDRGFQTGLTGERK
jgi:hypothetical protein